MAARHGGESQGSGLAGLLRGGGLLGSAVSFARVMREIDLDGIERQLHSATRVMVTATDGATAERIAHELFGSAGQRGWSIAAMPIDQASGHGEQPHLVILAVGDGEWPADLLTRLGRSKLPPPTVVAQLDPAAPPPALRGPLTGQSIRIAPLSPDEPASLAERIAQSALDLVPELALPLGRRFPLFRTPVAGRLIHETSRANAQFALLSSLPAGLPLLGGALGGAADLAVLTKNQALLVYKLAGLHGRALDDRAALAIEIAPVVGGAFFWRSLARTLLGLLPPVVGGLSKAAVAYSGTFIVGHMARYYYSTGRRPPPELIERFQVEGARLAGELAFRLRSWRERGWGA